MKNLLLILTIFVMFAPCAFSAPNYNPNGKPIIYDDTVNIKLRNKLEDDFHKKYLVSEKVTKDGIEIIHSYPPDGYYKEVLEPFYNQQVPMEDLPHEIYKK